MSGVIRRLLRTLAFVERNFRGDTRGNVAIIFAFASVALLVGTGAGIDLARAYFARQKLSAVATLTCQYATRPSVANTYGANALYTANVNSFANNELAIQKWPSSSMPTGGSSPNGSTGTYFTATGAVATGTSQQPTGVAELWYNVPTTFMAIVSVSQITVHAVMNCTPPVGQGDSQCTSCGGKGGGTTGTILVSEGFETGRSSYYFTNPSGQTAALSTPLSTFPLTAGYQGDGGNQWYIMGYCLEIDQVGVINSSDPQGTHSAELDCDNGSGSAGNSSMSTKAYLTVGYYELRYNYRSRVDYPNYDPTYICGSTASDLSWANDTDGSTYGTRTNQINVYFDQSVNNAAPPLHSTLDGTQQLAGGNLIDECVYGPNWLERSVKIKVTTAGFYWLSFAADGHNDSYGGQLDNIRLCVEVCTTAAGETLDNFPSSWTANLVLFEDGFTSPTYTAGSSPSMSFNGNLANSLGTTVSWSSSSCRWYVGGSSPTVAPTGWPCQAATGWAVAPYNQINYYTQGAYQGSQYIAIDGNNSSNSSATTTNRLISRPFLLDPGYYQVSYDYISNVNFNGGSTTCAAAPASGVVFSTPYASAQGNVRYGGSIVTNVNTNVEGVFMSHGQLVSTPNLSAVASSQASNPSFAAPWAVSADTSFASVALGAATTYTNTDGTVTSTPAAAPDAVNYLNYSSSVNNPLLDTCGYSPNFGWQTRSVPVKITKVGVYWLTISSNGGAADGYGPGIDDVRLIALGSPFMSSPPSSNLTTIPTPAPASGSNYSNNGAFTGFYIVADPFQQPAADQ